MAMHPQSPQANAPCTLATEATIHMEAAAAAATIEPELPAPATTEPPIREQDRLMPIANVVRIMRRVLPPHAKIADDAKEVIQECVSEFISFVTGEANDRCHGEHRKTVTADDVVWAMERLGFDDYVAPLKAYLRRMRDCEGTGGRGDRAAHQARAPHGPMAACHGMQVAFPNAAVARGYGVVPHQVPFSAAPRFGAAQYVMLGGERSVAAAAAAFYGGPAPVTDGSGCAEETSSSNEEPEAAAATTSRPQHPN